MNASIVLLGSYAIGMLIAFYFIRFAGCWRDRLWDVPWHNPIVIISILLWPLSGIYGLAYLTTCVISRVFGSYILLILSYLDAKVAHLCKSKLHADEYGTLYQMPSSYGSMRVVRVGDNTGTYWLQVPPHMNTAKEAVAWTYGKSAGEYSPVRS